MSEELGVCIGCNKPLLVGQVITAWDDEAGHYDCANPYSQTRQPDLDADPDTPPPVVLLGNPAFHISLSHIEDTKALRCALRPFANLSYYYPNDEDSAPVIGTMKPTVGQCRNALAALKHGESE